MRRDPDTEYQLRKEEENDIVMDKIKLDSNALDALINNQRQLDADGCEVGVSRQALDELLAAYNALAATISEPKDGMVLVPRELSIKQKVPGVRAYCKVAGECRPVALAAAWTAICNTFADAPTSEPVAVKALEWGHDEWMRGSFKRQLWTAASGFGNYRISQYEDDDRAQDQYYLRADFALMAEFYPTLEAAIAAAQADYERRIRSVLVSTPPAAPAALDVAITDDMVRRAASEYLMHKGERPWRVLRGGQELWETCAPAMRAALATLKATRETT